MTNEVKEAKRHIKDYPLDNQGDLSQLNLILQEGNPNVTHQYGDLTMNKFKLNSEQLIMKQIYLLCEDLGVPGLYDGVVASSENSKAQQWTTQQSVLLGLQMEQHRRSSIKLKKMLEHANLYYPEACEDNINFEAHRGLKRSEILPLMECEWIRQQQNCIIIGKVGVGKTWLACALGNAACRNNLSVLMISVPELTRQIIQIIFRGEDLSRLMRRLLQVDLLILDDWGLGKLSAPSKDIMFELLDKRSQNKSILLTSTLPINEWASWTGDPDYVRLNLDGIICRANEITFESDSLEEKTTTCVLACDDAKECKRPGAFRKDPLFRLNGAQTSGIRDIVWMILQNFYDSKKGYPSTQQLQDMIGEGSFSSISKARKQWLIQKGQWQDWLAGKIKIAR